MTNFDMEKGTKKWSDSETSKLISLYHANSILWDFSRMDYRDRVKKNQAFQEISEIFQTDTTEVQRKIHNLRSQYHAELKKLQKKSAGDGADISNNKSNWPFFSSLTFIQVRNLRKSKNNTTTTIDTSSCKQSDDEEELEEDNVEEILPISFENNTYIDEEVSQSAFETFEPPLKKKKTNTDSTNLVHEILGQLNRSNEEEQIFGDFCASELRQLQLPQNKRLLKKIVMEAIMSIAEADSFGEVYRCSNQVPLYYKRPTNFKS